MTLGLATDRTKICHIFAGCRRLRWLCHSLVRAAVRLPKSVVVLVTAFRGQRATPRALCSSHIRGIIGVKGLCPGSVRAAMRPRADLERIHGHRCECGSSFKRDRGADSLVLHMHAVGRSEVVDDVVTCRR